MWCVPVMVLVASRGRLARATPTPWYAVAEKTLGEWGLLPLLAVERGKLALLAFLAVSMVQLDLDPTGAHREEGPATVRGRGCPLGYVPCIDSATVLSLVGGGTAGKRHTVHSFCP